MTITPHAIGVAALLFGAALAICRPAAAQELDCATLRSRIEASSNPGARAGPYASALRQQQYELRRTQAYQASIGCTGGSLFEGEPPECDAIAARIEHMQDSIAQLQQQLRGDDDNGYRRRALTEQYNAFCTGGPPEAPAEQPPPDRQVMPVDPDAAPEPGDGSSAEERPVSRRSPVRALCVRHCDGGYFPITEAASPAALESLDQLCKALCPNTEASLYTAAPSAEIQTAIALDGTPYPSLPAAFRFQKTFDAACSCKPAHQSWVEALAEAEKMIERAQGDVTVTQTMSDAMSRPGTVSPAAAAPAAKAPRKSKAARKAKPPAPGNDALSGVAPPAPVALPGTEGEDLTQQFRRDGPLL